MLVVLLDKNAHVCNFNLKILLVNMLTHRKCTFMWY